jgi:TRAP-type C4-dicarboxylate transport system permease small subunit
MQLYARVASLVFGITMLLLSVAVTVETLIRKLFSISLGGVDELSGYAIAIGAPVAFAVTLIDQSHIRINMFYAKVPPKGQAVLNALAALCLGILAVFLLIFTYDTVTLTQTYRSIAQTPWATPLIYPQAAWLIAMAAFAVPAVWLMGRAILLLIRGNWKALNSEFSPESVEDELESELEDFQQR